MTTLAILLALTLLVVFVLKLFNSNLSNSNWGVMPPEAYLDVVVIDPFEYDWDYTLWGICKYEHEELYVEPWTPSSTHIGHVWDQHDDDHMEDLMWELDHNDQWGRGLEWVTVSNISLQLVGNWLMQESIRRQGWDEAWAWWKAVYTTMVICGDIPMHLIVQHEAAYERLWARVARWETWAEAEQVLAQVDPWSGYTDSWDGDWDSHLHGDIPNLCYYCGGKTHPCQCTMNDRSLDAWEWQVLSQDKDWLAWWQAQDKVETEEEAWERRLQVRVKARKGLRGASEKGLWQDQPMRTRSRVKVTLTHAEYGLRAVHTFNIYPSADIAEWKESGFTVEVEPVEKAKRSPRKPRRRWKLVNGG